jgi:hypothetical protein
VGSNPTLIIVFWHLFVLLGAGLRGCVDLRTTGKAGNKPEACKSPNISKFVDLVGLWWIRRFSVWFFQCFIFICSCQLYLQALRIISNSPVVFACVRSYRPTKRLSIPIHLKIAFLLVQDDTEVQYLLAFEGSSKLTTLQSYAAAQISFVQISSSRVFECGA